MESAITVHQVPCIQFLDKDTQDEPVLDYVLIVRSGSAKPCYSQLGRVGGQQRLGLNKKCFENDNIEKGVHELMHALGKVHMEEVFSVLIILFRIRPRTKPAR